MNCKQCGAPVRDDETICESCGAPLDAVTEEPAQAKEVAAPKEEEAVAEESAAQKAAPETAAEEAASPEAPKEAPADATADTIEAPAAKEKKRHPVLISVICTALVTLLLVCGLAFGAAFYLQSSTQVALRCFKAVNVDFDYQQYMSCFAPSSREAIQEMYYKYNDASTPEEMQALLDEAKADESRAQIYDIKASLTNLYLGEGIADQIESVGPHLIEDTDFSISDIKTLCDVKVSFKYGHSEDELTETSSVYTVALIEGAWYVVY